MVRPVIAGLASHGVDPADLLDGLNIDPEILVDPDGRIPHGVVLSLWDQAQKATADDAFGLHIAEGIDVSTFDVQGYILLSSATLGQGMERVMALHRINHDAARMVLSHEEVGAVWAHSLPGDALLPRQPAEFVIAASVVAARQATDGELRPLAVRFRHPRPADISEHERIFGCQVRFECDHNAIVFREDSLSLRCRKADPMLLGVLERHAEALLTKLPDVDTFVSHVRSLLSEELRGGNPSAEHIADKLHMSVRTLSRRLKEHDTNHKQLLDDIRRELCDSYMRDQRLGIADIAYLLGFGDASSFHRAFKRWHDQTPATYRKQLT